MKTIRLFISSPGDVAQEREICRRALVRLNREFHGRAQLDGYFWEYEPMEITRDYQEQIPPPSSFDIFVCILWSRLGSRLHSRYQLPDGRPCRSGTEFEFVDAIEGRKRSDDGTPDILVWVNKTQPLIPLEPEKDYEQRIEQWRLLKSFLAEWTRCDDEGVFTGAVNSYRSLDKFEELFEVKLRKLVERRLGSALQPGELPPIQWTHGSPYRGLEAFGKEHAEVFFGRTAAIESVLNAVRRQGEDARGFVLVLGASGSGKSSLVSAGVLPMLTTPGVIEGIGLWREATFRPGLNEDVLLGLAKALLGPDALPELADPEESDPAKGLAERFKAVPESAAESVRLVLNEAARAFQADRERRLRERVQQLEAAGRVEDAEAISKRIGKGKPPRARLVLVLDQLEELSTGAIADDDRKALIAILEALSAGGRVVVLASLRSDFYHLFQETPGMLALAGEHGKVDVLPPDAHEIGQIIREPARMAGLVFEKDASSGATLDEVLRDAALDHPEALPLLEHALDQLYACQAKRDDRTLRFEDYEAIGKLDGALARHADSVFQSVSAAAQSAFDQVFRGLVTLGREDRIPVRRTARRAALSEPPAADELVTALIDQRLLTTGQTAEGEPVVSVAHEALLRVWDRARTWIDANEDFLAVRARVGDACTEWENAGEDTSFLLQPGRQLVDAEDALTRHAGAFEPKERAFVKASRERAERTERRRKRVRQGVMAGMAGLTGLAVFGFFQAETKRKEAEAAVQRETEALGRAKRTSGAAAGFLETLLGETDWVGRLQQNNAALSLEFLLESDAFMTALLVEDLDEDLLDKKTRAQSASVQSLFRQGDREGALQALEASQETLEQLESRLPDNVVIQANLANHRYVRGKLFQDMQKLAEAASSYQEGLTLIDNMATWKDHESVREAWYGLMDSMSRVQSMQGESEASAETFGNLDDQIQQWASAGETKGHWWERRIQLWVDRSEALSFQGANEQAAEALERAQIIVREAMTENAPFLALRVERSWGQLESFRGNHAKAANHLKRWLDEIEPVTDEEPLALTMNRLHVARQYLSALTLSPQQEALEPASQQVLDLANRIIDRDSQSVSTIDQYRQSLSAIGYARQVDEDYGEAIDFYQLARQEAERLEEMQPGGRYLATILEHAYQEAFCWLQMANPKQAEAVISHAWPHVETLIREVEEANHPEAVGWRRNIIHISLTGSDALAESDPVEASRRQALAIELSKGDQIFDPMRPAWIKRLQALRQYAEPSLPEEGEIQF